MNSNHIKILLEHQAKLILNLIASIEYLKGFPKYLNHIEEEKPKALWFIHNSIRDITIINLTQLFHGKEEYSFNKLRLLLKELDNTHENLLIEFDEAIKPGNKLFKQLQILKIRNEHVGHLLSKREKASIDWNLGEDLISIARKTHDIVYLRLFNSQNYWLFDQFILNEIFSNDLQSRETYKLWRKMNNEDKETIDKEELHNLIKINWTKQP